MSVKIIPFTSKYADDFKKLNVTWLEKYFHVEPKDDLLLSDCENSIIGKGGYIFIALYKDTPVGCFSFIPFKDNNYERGKMAVHPNYQGLKIGQQLLSFAIDFAKRSNWETITLYSSSKLPAALYIYSKYGFKEVALEKDLPYVRSDIKMELLLIDGS